MITQFLTVNLSLNCCCMPWPGFSICVSINLRSSHIFSQWLRLISWAYLLEISKHARWIQFYVSVTDQKCSTALVLTVGHLTIDCSNYIGCQLLPSFLPKLTAYSAVAIILGVTGLSRKERRKYEDQKAQALGGKVGTRLNNLLSSSAKSALIILQYLTLFYQPLCNVVIVLLTGGI